MSSSSGPRETATLLLEGSQTNWVTYSEDYSTSSWQHTNASKSSAQADPKGGTAAWRIIDNSTSTLGRIDLEFPITSSGVRTYSQFVKRGSTTSAGQNIRLLSSAGTNVVLLTLTWSSGVPTVGYTNGSSVAVPERYRDGWWRVAGKSTVSLSSGSYTVRITPADTDTKGDIVVFGSQVE